MIYIHVQIHMRVMQEHQASTSGMSEAAPSPIQPPAKQSALHINATAGTLAQSALLPQTSGRARQLTYHLESHQASASGRSSLEESGSSTMSGGWSAASCSTSFPDSQAAIRSRPGASASSSSIAESSSQAATGSMPDASASSSYTAESSGAAGTAGIASRVGSSISTVGKALLGTVAGLGIPDASAHGSQRLRPGTWQASDVPELLLSILERTPVVGLLTAVPIAAVQFGVKSAVTAGSRFSQLA